MSSSISPNMNLIVPGVSTEDGPTWASDLNASLSIIDQHNHSAGSGIQITQAGILLSPSASTFDSLSFNSSNAYNLRSVRFAAQSAALALAGDVGCLYEAGVDLYYNDGAGNQIRITQGGAVSGSAGTITGLPSGTASAAYSGGTFIFQSATSTAANIDGGSFILRNSSASSKGLTLNPPAAMAANYFLNLPSLPASQSFLTLDTGGNIGNYAPIAGGLTGSNIANTNSITGDQITTTLVIGSSITITPGYAITPAGTTYKTNALNECFVLSSGTASAGGMRIVRGCVASNGAVTSGDGFSVTGHPSAGNYVIIFDHAYSDAPAVAVTLNNGAAGYTATNPTTASSIQVITFSATTTQVDQAFSFIAIGAI